MPCPCCIGYGIAYLAKQRGGFEESEKDIKDMLKAEREDPEAFAEEVFLKANNERKPPG